MQQARLTPATPASLMVVQLHFERWTCAQAFGQQNGNELSEEDGTVEVKLTAAVEQPNTLKMVATFGRIDASGLMGESLRSGSLGEDLRDQVAQSVLAAARAGLDFKSTFQQRCRTLL